MINALALYGGVALIGLLMAIVDWFGRRRDRHARGTSAETRTAG
jgi:hypothetical protein